MIRVKEKYKSKMADVSLFGRSVRDEKLGMFKDRGDKSVVFTEFMGNTGIAVCHTI